MAWVSAMPVRWAGLAREMRRAAGAGAPWGKVFQGNQFADVFGTDG
jgi:hypothetical protein